MALIYHISYRSHWNFAKLRDEYKADSLQSNGFIHCCEKKQLIDLANTLYAGEKDLLILVIDSNLLSAELRYEAQETGGNYPHIYGPLNLDAVIQVLNFRQNAEGKYVLPNQLL